MKLIVNIERINNNTYSFKKSNKMGIKEIVKSLTFDNPDPFAYSPTISMFNKTDFTFEVGMIKTVKHYLNKNGVNFHLLDNEYKMPNIEFDSRLSGKYEYQRDAVRSFFLRRFGIIVVPTRGGKTFLAAEIIRLFLESDKGQFLFITDNTTLFLQVINDFKKFFNPYFDIDIGEIKAGKIELDKRVTVGMIQTIQSTFSKRCKDNVKKRNLTKYLHGLKFICIDEIHDNSSDTRMKIYKKCTNLEYQLCLSATPYKDGELKKNLHLQAWSGGILYDIKESTLRSSGVLSNYKIFLLFLDHSEWLTGENLDYSDSKKTLLTYNKNRNDVLLKIISILKTLNLKTLFLFQEISHGELLSELTGIPFLSGKTKPEVREIFKNNFLSADGGFLFASGIFKKGITLPEVEVLVNVDGGLQGANTIQKKGRVLGVTDDKKKSLIIDFFDHDNSYFSEHSETRLNTYIEAIGDDNIGILDVSSAQCFKILTKWIKTWFEDDNDYLDMQ